MELNLSLNPIEKVIKKYLIPKGLDSESKIMELLMQHERFQKAGKKQARPFIQKIRNFWKCKRFLEEEKLGKRNGDHSGQGGQSSSSNGGHSQQVRTSSNHVNTIGTDQVEIKTRERNARMKRVRVRRVGADSLSVYIHM